MTLGSVMKSPGSKWRLASRIVELFPAHRIYLEPFGGSLAVLLRKPRSTVETVNDIDGEISNLYRVLRDPEHRERLIEAVELTPWAEVELFAACEESAGQLDGVERARRLVVRSWMNTGSRQVNTPHFAYAATKSGGSSGRTWASLPARIRVVGERLTGVQILNRDASEVIAAHASEDVCIYADPPYPRETRKGAGRLYRCEMDDAAHGELLEVLVTHPGPVALSGYRCPLYDEALIGWTRFSLRGYAQSHGVTEEVLWLNPTAASNAPNTLF